MTTLQQLLAAHPKAVDDINSTWPTKLDPKSVDTTSAIIREHAVKLGVASYAEACLDSVASLLSAIEAKLAADAPLSDEQIEGMKWRYWRGGSHCIMRGETIIRAHEHKEAADYLIEQQNKVVDALAREIRRLRAEVGRKESPDAR